MEWLTRLAAYTIAAQVGSRRFVYGISALRGSPTLPATTAGGLLFLPGIGSKSAYKNHHAEQGFGHVCINQPEEITPSQNSAASLALGLPSGLSCRRNQKRGTDVSCRALWLPVRTAPAFLEVATSPQSPDTRLLFPLVRANSPAPSLVRLPIALQHQTFRYGRAVRKPWKPFIAFRSAVPLSRRDPCALAEVTIRARLKNVHALTGCVAGPDVTGQAGSAGERESRMCLP